jgi:hypothetical protein
MALLKSLIITIHVGCTSPREPKPAITGNQDPLRPRVVGRVAVVEELYPGCIAALGYAGLFSGINGKIGKNGQPV